MSFIVLARANVRNMIMFCLDHVLGNKKVHVKHFLLLFERWHPDSVEPNEPGRQDILNFFVNDVSILNLLLLLTAGTWPVKRGEQAVIKSSIDTIRTLGPVMAAKKSNWLAPGMWVIINTHTRRPLIGWGRARLGSDWLLVVGYKAHYWCERPIKMPIFVFNNAAVCNQILSEKNLSLFFVT